ncbi:hypothetical protein GpartN1_g3998.t1 [Galdieria partita]|uniref:Uncharacterized protein n=1 Tax=Galdieria partita TaxID=83374 RepID=A0A9C7PZ74_9RHOD|nr:hypothetical protein GpartN1_g3998.t1 [Galdieria partita]
MASAIHFKMKSEKDFSTLSFDGDFLKVSDLKLLVVEKRKLNFGDGFDLVITDAQTNEEYTDESTLIPKNTSVVIKRVPGQKPGGILSQQTLARRNERYAEKDLVKSNAADSLFGDKTKRASVAGGEQPREVEGEAEDERINSVVDSSGITFSQRPRFNQHNPVFDRPPPPNYRCHRCGKPGHWIHHCPTNGDPNFDIVRVRRPTGIPRSMLQSVEAPVRGTGLRTPGGEFVTLKPNQDEFSRRTAALRRMVEQRQGASGSDTEAGNVDNGTVPLLMKDSHDNENAFFETQKELNNDQVPEDVIRNEFENKSNYQEQEYSVYDQVGDSLNAVSKEMEHNLDWSQSIVNPINSNLGSRRREDVDSKGTLSSYSSVDISHDHDDKLSWKDIQNRVNKETHREYSMNDEKVVLEDSHHHISVEESAQSSSRTSECQENNKRSWGTRQHCSEKSAPKNNVPALYPMGNPTFYAENMPVASFPTGYPNMTPALWPFPVFPFQSFGQSFAPINNTNHLSLKDAEGNYFSQATPSVIMPHSVKEPKVNENSKTFKRRHWDDDERERNYSHSSSEQRSESHQRYHKRSRPKQKR